MKTAKEYRVEAKKALSGHWGIVILMFIVYGLLFTAISATFVGSIVLSGALTVGMAYAMSHLCRTGEISFENMFAGFNHPKFSATVGVYVKTVIFTALWSILFVIPGIVAAYSYSMAPYIMNDHPEMNGGEAIRASKKLMEGKKGKLFCLGLSFIGWVILCVLTFGILAIWVGPWMEAAKAEFYESIKDEVI